ncbi:hypothetical protein CRU87_02625 [Aliarcobacter trophiarum LMG 25534]|uniref:Cytochrome c domain-containing protein n=1 Tax=Aliarcobacter trophiarum LMG 25534 TaxID=1032241 RepID=A0AAD0VM20_9BACT|nr:hypothetical protein [Aliarcobacter trophiarum]AXK48963.1 hypothetical protein ATR_1100 [Aliarcobacter trophiarum LMG 25534]RXI24857.1 hypothetical protein CRU89_08565 [Aliarcobacter trophiarum]RXJ92694.1 hypothetical protein CRU87_02625 [Aliarcobacter trophiarum LMG 25534]
MVRVVFLLCLASVFAFSNSKNIYEKNCITCHNKIPVTIDKYFYRYLLEYSNEEDVKNAMFDFLKNPTKEGSLMSESIIKRFGLKRKTRLSDDELKEALDIYWREYNLFDKLK